MGELGFLAGPVGPEYGGRAMDYVSFAQVYAALGYADPVVRGFLAVHGGLVTLCIRDHGTDEQRRTWLPRLATGDVIGCYCLTEPGAGSDAAAIATTARRGGDGYVLDGEKIWITNGNRPPGARLRPRPGLPADPPHRQICAFLVPTDTPGFARPPWPRGPRPPRRRPRRHHPVTVPRAGAHLLGPPGAGFRVAMGALDHGRLGVAAGALGVAEASLDAAVAFARERRAFGQRIGDFEMIQAALADMAADVDAARQLVYRAAWLKEQGQPSTRDTATAKLFATEAAVRAARRC